MWDVSLMTSAAFSPPLFHQELSRSKPSKELQALVPFHTRKNGPPMSLYLSNQNFGDHEQAALMLSDCARAGWPKSAANILDAKDPRTDSILFSLAIAEKCNRHDKILKLLMSGANKMEQGLSLLSDLIGIQAITADVGHQRLATGDDLDLSDIALEDKRHLFCHRPQFDVPNHLLDLVGIGSMPHGSALFLSGASKIEDLFPIVAAFNVSKKSENGSKASLLVPYFDRKRLKYARFSNLSPEMMLQTKKMDAPSKSLEEQRTKMLSKKKDRREGGKERDLYQKNYFHACESLLSVLLDKNRSGVAVLSLKKSGPAITQLLTQFSIGIAGTGLAVLLTIVCKTAGTRVPISLPRLLNTGFGIGLFWLSSAVNGLRDTITSTFKTPSTTMDKEEEVAMQVERHMNDVILRAMALLVLAAMQFA